MLKVTLEAGGYLILVKDEDGNLIKEYNLEIVPRKVISEVYINNKIWVIQNMQFVRQINMVLNIA